MPNAVSRVSPTTAFAANAPKKSAGQTRAPNSVSDAIAIPVGGHTAVTCCVAKASERPNLAASRYASATRARGKSLRLWRTLVSGCAFIRPSSTMDDQSAVFLRQYRCSRALGGCTQDVPHGRTQIFDVERLVEHEHVGP